MKKENDWKERLGIVYSTNSDFNYDLGGDQEMETLPPEKQNLRVSLSTKHRKGKTVSLVTGFRGKTEDLVKLEKLIKTKCATGGSSKDGEIIIQGDKRELISTLLRSLGYKIR